MEVEDTGVTIREAIWGDVDPYLDIVDGVSDLQGWSGSCSELLLAAARDAKTIAEIGVWKGASVIGMAEVNPAADILAVDTWRGSAEHWLRERWKKDVYGDLYRKFRVNVLKQRCLSLS